MNESMAKRYIIYRTEIERAIFQIVAVFFPIYNLYGWWMNTFYDLNDIFLLLSMMVKASMILIFNLKMKMIIQWEKSKTKDVLPLQRPINSEGTIMLCDIWNWIHEKLDFVYQQISVHCLSFYKLPETNNNKDSSFIVYVQNLYWNEEYKKKR